MQCNLKGYSLLHINIYINKHKSKSIKIILFYHYLIIKIIIDESIKTW
jgi:hypothetical protein